MSAIVFGGAAPCSAQRVHDVWIGTGRARLNRIVQSKGIYTCTLDAESGGLGAPRLAAEIDAPGFLALHPRGDTLYAVGRLGREAVVAAYAISRDEKGAPALTLRNALPIGGGTGTHVAVDPSGRVLLTAQYGGGSVACFALREDGALAERTQLVQHEGGSRVVGKRQDAPHPHWTGFSADGRFAFVPDLGLDAVVRYAVDAGRARITPRGQVAMPAGSGPRHMAFHPDGARAFVLGELTLAVTACSYDAESGEMRATQTLPTLPAAELAGLRAKSASEIRVHPSGRFVYSANRGHDTVTVFAMDEESGALRRLQVEPIRGATPRNFGLDPDGRFLLAAGQDSHTLASFAIDRASGELRFANSIQHVPAPICVLVARR